jgi:hypothetical protein
LSTNETIETRMATKVCYLFLVRVGDGTNSIKILS